ncbi:uncharacterized protein Fot_49708 [Forsythia ovata]
MVQMYRETEEFYCVFAFGVITLILLARISAKKDPLFLLRALILQCAQVAIGYFVDTNVGHHVYKGFCVLAVSLVGLFVLIFDDFDAELATNFFLSLFPVDFRG